MHRSTGYALILSTAVLLGTSSVLAQNPLITEQFSADPTARVFEGKIYVYCSHDIPVPPNSGAREQWFCMEDYHVYSSENLTDWTDHGVILTQSEVPWLNRLGYNMWAPDCVAKNGKYYFYFPTGGGIGVAVADTPYGPFRAEKQSIAGVRGIDPGVLIDTDGSAYLFWGGISVAKLKDNMVELDSQPQRVENLPRPGMIEGPFPFKRNGIYYLTFPHEVDGQERLEYSTASSPMGPYEWKGVVMDQSTSGCWTNHQSVVEYNGQWYLFYHDKDLSPDFDKNRAIKADYLHFNEDGTIQKVIPTHRGIGVTPAYRDIHIDRYSAISPEGVAIDFVDPENKPDGWKAVLSTENAWVRYDRVDFGQEPWSGVKVTTRSTTGGRIALRVGAEDGATIAEVEIRPSQNWTLANGTLTESPEGLQNLVVVNLDEEKTVEIDCVTFK